MTNKIKLVQPLRGIIPPMVTPLRQDMSLDVAGLNRLVEHLLAGGASGLFILGTTGESASLRYALRYKLVDKTCQAVNGRVPVLVGITDTSFAESIDLAKAARSLGAAAVVAAPPYYFHLNQQELFTYYQSLADSIDLPLFLYNLPSLTKIPIDLTTAVKLSEHANIVGLKDSSANAVYFQSLFRLLSAKPEFTLLVGPEEIMSESVLMGAHGGISGGANMFPRLYVKLYEAASKRDLEEVDRLQSLVMEISTKMYTVGSYSSSYLKAIKMALSILGICESHMAPPLSAFNGSEKEKIGPILEQIKVALGDAGVF